MNSKYIIPSICGSIITTCSIYLIYTKVRQRIQFINTKEPIYILYFDSLNNYESEEGIIIPRHIWWGFLDHLVDNNFQTTYGLLQYRNLSVNTFRIHINYYNALQSYLYENSLTNVPN